jgi:nucleotide-binding universal stress UspA family protein
VTGGVASGALNALAVVSGTPPVEVSLPLAAAAASDRWLEGAVAAGVPRDQASSEVVPGEPTREILDAARRLDADLIIMGRRSSGNLRRAVLGSVVEAVLGSAPCPVLVVPESAAKE